MILWHMEPAANCIQNNFPSKLAPDDQFNPCWQPPACNTTVSKVTWAGQIYLPEADTMISKTRKTYTLFSVKEKVMTRQKQEGKCQERRNHG
jgi:hypothetical protein